ncbi:hypothetical protein QBC37DRAFT_324853 [Rhypophila decipiens]|uniref:BZIP domain-containing protein n=1 Tax=Rhypophila decipiens TaxID=261697 RepID=A0AAN6XYC3_9PEZI|nr:hypothetical protein QBC37DRAFT_324853 [Rhypophila decipiens]
MPASYGRNVNPYLRDLNHEVIEDAAAYPPISEEQLSKELDLFTNTAFFDIDAGQTTDFQAPPVKPDTYEPASATSDVSPVLDDFSTGNLDFLNSIADHGTMSPGDFGYTDFSSNYTSPTIPAFPDQLNLQPIQPNPHTAYPSHVSPHQQPGYVPHAGAPVPPQRIGSVSSGVGVGLGGLGVGEKRKAEQIGVTTSSGRILSLEEQSRLAAEEDKRKRNTAASARFRVKKKQREQALEKSAKDMADKVTKLEERISLLETENRFLKSLVTEKHGGGTDEILKKFVKELSGKGDAHSKDERSSSSRGSTSSASSVASSITAAPASSDSSAPASKKAKKN